MRRLARLLGASVVGAAVPGVSGDAHASNAVLGAAAAGHSIAAKVAEVLEQPDVLDEQQLELGLSEVREAEASGAALDGVGSSWTNVLDRHNHNMGRAGDTAIGANTVPSTLLVSVSGTAAAAL